MTIFKKQGKLNVSTQEDSHCPSSAVEIQYILFYSGMKPVVDYVKSKGFKFGLVS